LVFLLQLLLDLEALLFRRVTLPFYPTVAMISPLDTPEPPPRFFFGSNGSPPPFYLPFCLLAAPRSQEVPSAFLRILEREFSSSFPHFFFEDPASPLLLKSPPLCGPLFAAPPPLGSRKDSLPQQHADRFLAPPGSYLTLNGPRQDETSPIEPLTPLQFPVPLLRRAVYFPTSP